MDVMNIRRYLMMMGVKNIDMDKWEYINTVSIDTDSEIISCTTDSSGNSIKLKAAAVIVYAAVSTQTTGNSNLGIAFSSGMGHSSANELIVVTAGIRTTPQQNIAWIEIQGIIEDGENKIPSPAENLYTTFFSGGYKDGTLRRSISTYQKSSVPDGYIHHVYVMGKYFGPGSFIRVYGVKA